MDQDTMTLDEALEARATALREGYIDTEAIEAISRHVDGSDPRHPFHGAYMLGKKLAERRNAAVMAILGVHE